ncbi:MAG: hypothetical protein ACI97A_003964 [Planctomycetota bacterium]|jgi:hypothetical protein
MMTMAVRATFWAMTFLLAICSTAKAQGPTIAITSNNDSIAFGDTFELTVTRTWNSKHETEAFLVSDLGLRRVVQAARAVTHSEGVTTEQQVFECFAFQPSQITIPSVQFSVRNPETNILVSVQSNKIIITIMSALPPGDQGAMELPRGLFAGLGVSKSNTLWFVIGAAVLVVFGLYVGKTRMAARSEIRWTPTSTQADLSALSDKIATDSPEFYRRLLGTIRRFFIGAYGLPAEEMTSGELVERAAMKLGLAAQDTQAMREVLSHCDLAIWGDGEFDQVVRVQDIESIRLILEFKEEPRSETSLPAEGGPNE